MEKKRRGIPKYQTIKKDERIALLERIIHAIGNSSKDNDETISAKNRLIHNLITRNTYLECKIKDLTSIWQKHQPESVIEEDRKDANLETLG